MSSLTHSHLSLIAFVRFTDKFFAGSHDWLRMKHRALVLIVVSLICARVWVANSDKPARSLEPASVTSAALEPKREEIAAVAASPQTLNAPSLKTPERAPNSEKVPVERYLISGLERFSLSPETEEFILRMPIRAGSKKLLLSAAVLNANRALLKIDERMQLSIAMQKEIESLQKELIDDFGTVLAKRSEFPQDFERDLLSVVSRMQQADAPEVRIFALAQFHAAKSADNREALENRQTLAQSMAAYVWASPVPSQGLKDLRKTIDMTDLHQMVAYFSLQQMIQTRKPITRR